VPLSGDPRSFLVPGRTYRFEITDMVKDLVVCVSRSNLQVRKAIEIIDFVPKESRAAKSSLFNVTVTVPETDIAIDKCILETADKNGTIQSLTVDAE
jgi:hypothetical protein